MAREMTALDSGHAEANRKHPMTSTRGRPRGKRSAAEPAPPAEPPRRLSIGQLAALTKVSTRTIRYYEELGILPEPERSLGGTRQYSAEHRFYIEGALALKEVGFSLEEIRLLGQFALEHPMTKFERQQATEAIRDKMQALEHKIRVLERLHGILHEHEPRARKAGRWLTG
jgi:DNA-binding transcriptional MerR regulator